MTFTTGLELALGAVCFVLWHVNSARADWKQKLLAERKRHDATLVDLEALKIGQVNLRKVADFQQRRADEFFSIIQGIEVERDTWRRFFEKSSHHAGVAQAWLLRELTEAVQRANTYAEALRKLGHQVRGIDVNPALKEVVEEFGLLQAKSKEIEHAVGLTGVQAVESGGGAPVDNSRA
jgi:hypothetical protein